LLACCSPRPSSHSCLQFADRGTRRHPEQPTARSFARACSSRLHCKIISPPLALSPRQHRPSAQIPITLLQHRSPPHCRPLPPAASLPPRFRALALFGRRSPKRVVRSSLPASENLHITCTLAEADAALP